MSDEPDSPGGDDLLQPTVEHAALSPNGELPGATTSPLSPNGTPTFTPVVPPRERPELIVGAAFAGGFALAILLRRLGR